MVVWWYSIDLPLLFVHTVHVKDPDDDEDEVAKLDRYYLSVLVKALMKILRDSALSSHHHAAGMVPYSFHTMPYNTMTYNTIPCHTIQYRTILRI